MTPFQIAISIFTILVSGGVFISLYKIGKKIGNFEKAISSIEKTLDKLPCKDREKQIAATHDDVLSIKMFLASKYKNTETIWGVKHSPTTLNENGSTLFKNINGESFLSHNKELLIKKIDSKQPMTALDVEYGAYEILVENTNNPIFNDLKCWIYESPSITIHKDQEIRQYIVTLYDVCYVLSIPLRDMYLQLHPELLPNSDI